MTELWLFLGAVSVFVVAASMAWSNFIMARAQKVGMSHMKEQADRQSRIDAAKLVETTWMDKHTETHRVDNDRIHEWMRDHIKSPHSRSSALPPIEFLKEPPKS